MIWALQHSAKNAKIRKMGYWIVRNDNYAENSLRLLEITLYNYFETRRKVCEGASNIIDFPSKIVNILTYKCV